MVKPKDVPTPKRPKGSYPLPNGNFVVKQGRLTVVYRNPPDYDGFARALLELAEEERIRELGSG